MALFNFKGCINRPTFWRLFLALSAAAAALILFPSLLASVISLLMAIVFPKYVYAWYYIYGVFVAILYVASLLSIMTRRLHDLGFNGWWLIVFLGPLILPAPADEFDFMRWWPDVFLGPRLLPTIALSALIGLFVLVGLFPRKMGSSSPTILRSIVYCSLFLLTFAFSYGLLILLCHKFRYLFRVAIGAAQHGQRDSVVTSATTNLRRIVAIEFGTWRSGRNGGSSALVIFA